MTTKPKVAICQASVILGGRLRVILGMIEILNEAGIVPDIITTRLMFPPDQLTQSYGRSVQVNYKLHRQLPGLRGEFSILLFNTMLNRYAADYDLLINTNNSLIFLPQHKDVITYMFFPRKRRIMANVVDIHRPESTFLSWSFIGIQRKLLRRIYRSSRFHARHKIVCMTEFTCAALKQEYDIPVATPVIYPPVDLDKFGKRNGQNCSNTVVTIGRFGISKRQFEQIKLAEQLPHINFHVIGFVSNRNYFQKCKQYVEQNNLKNVYLHPDASFEEMLSLLQESRFFLHSLINEPFGITAVQAIAAGCLPIVHDSGGQRETVPEPQLRYKHFDEIPALLKHLAALDQNAIDLLRKQLQEHISNNFDDSVFRRRMKAVLEPYIY